jgi:hypothetical protein
MLTPLSVQNEHIWRKEQEHSGDVVGGVSAAATSAAEDDADATSETEADDDDDDDDDDGGGDASGGRAGKIGPVGGADTCKGELVDAASDKDSDIGADESVLGFKAAAAAVADGAAVNAVTSLNPITDDAAGAANVDNVDINGEGE